MAEQNEEEKERKQGILRFKEFLDAFDQLGARMESLEGRLASLEEKVTEASGLMNDLGDLSHGTLAPLVEDLTTTVDLLRQAVVNASKSGPLGFLGHFAK